MTRVLIIDNIDSFTNNLAAQVHLVTGRRPVVVPHDTAYDDLGLSDIDAVVISPGPGRPSEPADFGVCREVIDRGERPILGVCLGHQGIAEVLGGTVAHAPTPAHGVTDLVHHAGIELFEGLPDPVRVVRYHSLVVSDVPEDIDVIATTGDGLVMALRHRDRPLWGVQFHPESLETRHGTELMRNFIRLARDHATARPASGIAARFAAAGGVLTGAPRVTPVAWPRDQSAYFRDHFAEAPSPFWLDAGGSDHPDARFSVMGGTDTDLRLTYTLRDRRMTLEGPEGTQSLTGDAFDLLGSLLESMSYDVDGLPADVPYRGGLVGYLGYELKALCGGSEAHAADLPDAALVWPSRFVVLDHRDRLAWLVDHRPLASAPDAPSTDRSPRPAPAWDAHTTPYCPGPVAAERLALRDQRVEYLGKIHEATRLIRDGESYEVCLTNRASLPAPRDPLTAYERMRTVSPVPYGAFLRSGDVSVLSSSPESFLRIDADRSISSAPIKGTRPRGTSPEHDDALRQQLSTSRKDRAENLMIVDLVRHDLNAVCEAGSVEVREPFAIQSFRSVHQMVSVVRGRLRDDVSSLDAVRSCYPPGSMVGAPKVRTMSIIDDLEGHARGVYSGAIGWLDADGGVRLSVVIRTTVTDGIEAHFGVGGAITALSDPDEEFTEILVKASIPHDALTVDDHPLRRASVG